MFLYGWHVDLDQRFEYKRRISASESMFLEEPLIDKKKRNLLSALLFDLIPIVTHPPKGDMPLRLEDIVGPLHELPPNHRSSLSFELALPGKQLVEIKLSYHKSNISCRIISKR